MNLGSIAERVAQLDWSAIYEALCLQGFATTGPLLSQQECDEIAQNYEHEELFRSRVVMARHGFGQGEYQYFSYPLPGLIEQLRVAFYAKLAPQANAWHQTMGVESRFPESLQEMLARCHEAGQQRPTPLLLKYVAGDYNCLHQDLYGEQVFPIQATFLLSKPGVDFEGGEFVMVEQRPRMQSKPSVIPLLQGEAVLFAVHHRPVQGTRGIYRVNMRHGVSVVRSGFRFTSGLIFHDAT